jgi:hypothetical protein
MKAMLIPRLVWRLYGIAIGGPAMAQESELY